MSADENRSGGRNVWIHRRAEAEVQAERRAMLERAAAGEALPLAGLTVAVKDNIDVAGMPTTAGCPAFAYEAAIDAVAVARLRTAGAVVVGKTNLDQFATGLVGLRSPYGAVADVRRPEYVGGGSSSGSAAAVALGEVDVALGTDTAGSGRIPAAFQGVVGAKPSLELVPTDGVIPACRSFDCVSVFAGSVELAERVLTVIADADALSSGMPGRAGEPALAVFPETTLAEFMSPGYLEAFAAVRAAVEADGVAVVEVDPAPFLQAGALLYGGAFVAERYAAVGGFVATHPHECDPVVSEIILGGGGVSAADYVRDLDLLQSLRAVASAELAGTEGLLLPTAPFQPTIEEVRAEPVEVNRALGVFTTFCNMLGMCAWAVPAGEADGGQFGVSVLSPAGRDRAAATVARRVQRVAADVVPLLVVGAHMRGMPLNGELTSRGGRLLEQVSTADCYRLYALDTVPAKPGLVRVEPRDGAPGMLGGAPIAGELWDAPIAGEPRDAPSDRDPGGAPIAGELWALPASGLGSLLASLPAPMALGRVTLADGRQVVGFLCEPAALAGAEEITRFGGWRAYLSGDEAGALVRTEG